MASPGTTHHSGRFGFLAGLRSVATGVLGAGLLTYLFLSLAGRILGPARFAPVSTLWALVFIIGPGIFVPLQQELGRVIAAQRAERGGGTAVRRASQLTAGVGVVTLLAGVAASRWLVDQLFEGQWALFWCFEGAVLAYAITYLVRGVLSGLGDFADFGRLVAYESVARLLIAGILVALGIRSAAAFGAAIAIAPLLSCGWVTRMGRRLRLTAGTPAAWRELTRAFGWLVTGSLFAQFLANAGPLAVQLLATSSQHAEAGRFLSALVIARISLYLFQAVQATILPNLAELAAQRRTTELRAAIRRLTLACLVLIVASTVGAFLLGPLAVRILFGADFAITARTMAILAAASAIYVLAAALNGASIAAASHRLTAGCWVVGCVVFGLGTLLSHDLFLRVELGYLLGSCAAVVVLLIGLPASIRRHDADPVDAGAPFEDLPGASGPGPG
ncbi:lipopolysaccharide biosynthesis protein [Nocardioides terrisoli]|uniref:lipopolysaccharide biosynthesis protein n=1 Tax=Nocardioides terrisoli TaxID=3388267 RepID=UPI00287B92CC|nr:hypothetical protein [Nocardioides marmorisolisilvae]